MATTIDAGISYPAEGQGGLTSDQWRTMLAGTDGVMSHTDDPAFDLTLGPEANTVHLSAGLLSAEGYVLETSGDVAVPVPTATGTYYLRAFLDPALLTAQANPDPASELPGPRQITGPVQVWIGTSSELTANTTGGKVSLPLWTIARISGQSILLATLADVRQFVAPALTVSTDTAKPPAATCWGYTTCVVLDTGDIWQVLYNGAGGVRLWNHVSNPDGVAFPYTSPQLSGVSGEAAPLYYQSNSWVRCRGSIQRATGTLSSGSDVRLGTFPAGSCPNNLRRFVVPGFTSLGWRFLVVRVQGDGQVWLYDSSIPTGTTVDRINLEGIEFRAEQ